MVCPKCKLVYCYSLTYEVTKAIAIRSSLKSMLTALGFAVDPGSDRPTREAELPMGIYATKNDTKLDLGIVVCDVAAGDEAVKPEDVAWLHSFAYKPTYSIMVAIPSATDDARRFAELSKVILVEDSDGSGVVQKVRELLEHSNHFESVNAAKGYDAGRVRQDNDSSRKPTNHFIVRLRVLRLAVCNLPDKTTFFAFVSRRQSGSWCK